MEYAVHEIEPVWDKNSRILILGSFPSVKSREGKFFLPSSPESFLEGDGCSVGGSGTGDSGGEKEDAFGTPCGGLGCDRFLPDRGFQ